MLRSVILAGAATALLAAPAFAGTTSSAHRDSQAEIEQTQALNRQASDLVKGQGGSPAQASALTFQAEPIAPSVLASLTNPPPTIANATVLDQSGKVMGAVQKVELTPDGRPAKVDVALLADQKHLVLLDARAVSYDADRNQIVAAASGEQLLALPRG